MKGCWAAGMKGPRVGLREKELEPELDGGLGGVVLLPLLLLLRRLVSRSELVSISS